MRWGAGVAAGARDVDELFVIISRRVAALGKNRENADVLDVDVR